MAHSKTRLRYAKAAPARVAHTLSEVFAPTSGDASCVGFVLAQLGRSAAPLLWVQDRLSIMETGQPYGPGTAPARPILRVAVSRPVDVLWAMEEGLRCAGLAGVIGEIWGDPPALSFTATKRLALHAESSGVSCWLIRRGAEANLSAARNRWRVDALPSTRHPFDQQAPGEPRWRAELFRSRYARPGVWTAQYDCAAHCLDMSAHVRDRAMAEGPDAGRQSATG